MSRYRFDELELEQSHQIARRLDIDQEREPRWFPAPRSRRAPRTRRYFSGLLYQPLPRPGNDNDAGDGE